MTVNLHIQNYADIQARKRIETLEEKRIVPNLMVRRRLTRLAKIVLYLADRCGAPHGPLVFGSAYGELEATASILHAIDEGKAISATAFQNSVYNTPASYYSIIHANHSEIVTLSGGDRTAMQVLRTAAIQALSHPAVLACAAEAIDIEGIGEVNRCIDFLEAGAALSVSITQEDATYTLQDKNYPGVSPSLWAMFELCEAARQTVPLIVAIDL